MVLAIALHEGIPGHHLESYFESQIDLPEFRSRAMEIRKYPAPFSFPYYTAYIEVRLRILLRNCLQN